MFVRKENLALKAILLVEQGLLVLLSLLLLVFIADEELLKRINQRIFKILNCSILNCFL